MKTKINNNKNKIHIEEEVKSAALGILICYASRRRLITYSCFVRELNDQLFRAEFGLYSRPGMRTWDLLRHLSTVDHHHGLGMISAIVVGFEKGIPGRGFFALAAELGVSGGTEREIWQREIEKVYATYGDIGLAPELPEITTQN